MQVRGAIWLALAGSIALLAYEQRAAIQTTVEDFMTPRGIRNNNPGNIRHSTTHWQGMAEQQTDENFVQFISPEYGLRALSKIIDTYANTYGLNTVRGIINRFAPSNENDTGAYVQAVADALGVSPDDTISPALRKPDLIAAIVEHENGQQPYTLAQIDTSSRMA